MRVDHSALAPHAAHSAQRPDIRGRIGVEHDQVRVHTGLQAPGAAPAPTEPASRSGGECREDPAEGHAGPLHVAVLVARIVLGHIADIGAEQDLTAALTVGPELIDGDAHELLDSGRIHLPAGQLEGPELECWYESHVRPPHPSNQLSVPGPAVGRGMRQHIDPAVQRGQEPRIVRRVRQHQPMLPMSLGGRGANDIDRHGNDAGRSGE